MQDLFEDGDRGLSDTTFPWVMRASVSQVALGGGGVERAGRCFTSDKTNCRN
jgi:hypothetical protein